MRSSNSFKRPLKSVRNWLRRKILSSGKIYGSRDPCGNEWLTVARKGRSDCKETTLTVDEYLERIDATEEISEMLQSEDVDTERLIELQEKISRRSTRASNK